MCYSFINPVQGWLFISLSDGTVIDDADAQ